MIPKKDVAETPLFLLATAGMRLIPDGERADLLNEICIYAKANTGFLLPDCESHIQVISGETEGLYGWIAANYLVGGFDPVDPKAPVHQHEHHTYGFLDMGGASAQIAFAPNKTEAVKHANDLKLLRLRQLSGEDVEHQVFVTTWLGFGVNEARKRYVARLVEASAADGVKELPDPCLPKGLRATLEGKEIEDLKDHKGDVHLVGTGMFTECQSQVYPLLDKDKPCMDKPCLLNGVHVPAIDFDVNHFVGVAEYWHTTHEIFGTTAAYDFASYQTQVQQFCSQDWDKIEVSVEAEKWGKKVDEDKAMAACFKASWLINVLHEGIGIPRVGIETAKAPKSNTTENLIESAHDKGFLEPFNPVNKIDDVEVSWTLGRMILYSSSQIPPAQKPSLPVGFGANLASSGALPSDFQFGGDHSTAKHDIQPSASFEKDVVANETDTHWHDTIWKEGESSPRRIPGILLFLVIFALAFLLLLGRERRRRLLRYLPFRGKRSYQPPTLQIPDFELGSFSDDESGYVTPRVKMGGVYHDEGSLGTGIGGRTDSRERLVTMSRDVSPSRARARSPLPPR